MKSDYLTALKFYFGRNRWAMTMRREGRSKVYYDRELSEGLKRIERRYMCELIWIAGLLLCFVPVFAGARATGSLIAACIFTAVHLFGIVPAVYLRMLPRPFAEHMKSTADLDEEEQAFHQEEIADDPHLEKLMRKYKSDDENYFGDESSPLYRLTKRKEEK